MKLHERYKFPAPEDDPDKYNNTKVPGNIVNNAALNKMSNALSSWKTRVMKMLFKDEKSFAEILKKEPMITAAELREFKAMSESKEGKAHSDRGKDLRSKNIGTHHLGQGGYRKFMPIWEKEDAERRANNLPVRLPQYTDPQTRQYLWARYKEDPVTKEFSTTDYKVKTLERHLVSNTTPKLISS